MSEMIERVARAIARCDSILNSGKDTDAGWCGWTEQARAAIAAMREPTATIMSAGYKAAVDNGDHAEEGEFTLGFTPAVWTAMIDAALTPAPEK